eukprot:EG_transcript_30927
MAAPPPEEADRRYLRDQNVPLIFDYLLRGLLQRKPEDAVQFLSRRLVELERAKEQDSRDDVVRLLKTTIDTRTQEECASLVIQSCFRRAAKHRSRVAQRQHMRQLENIVFVQALVRRFLAKLRTRQLAAAKARAAAAAEPEPPAVAAPPAAE